MLLRVHNISKSYGGVQALKRVHFELEAGEIHALVGENGAGKSTLIRVISGAVQPDAGFLEVDGKRVVIEDPLASKALGIAVIYQQPSLFPSLTVAENIGLALESVSLWRRISWKERGRVARDLLERVGARFGPEHLCGELSMPEQQLVEIAKSIGANARILILDEPTASLTNREVDKLFDVLRAMRERGTGIIYVSHRLDELQQIAGRVTVLRDGASLETAPMSSVSREDLVRMMVGREVSSVFPKRNGPLGDVVLDARGVSSPECGIRDVSLTVRAGEIVGLAGLVGAGRTEFAEILFGIRRAGKGTIQIGNREVAPGSPEDAVRLGIAYVPEDRRRNGLILEMPVAANATLGMLSRQPGLRALDFTWERDLASRYALQLGIKTASVDAPAKTLSGGNQQKVCLSRWMATQPSLLILDEPTQGVDVGAKAEIHSLMVEFASKGIAILMISSELPEILGMSDRIAVMREGSIAGVLSRSEATQQTVLSLALGLGEEARA
ncbi:MAG TPA: sugar ABC transporter ATP-binding protein [Bryobacteraceae bacterium]|nr:sugar ABC transporter ATP-binding protein [Bryobacteraceae bacterium]